MALQLRVKDDFEIRLSKKNAFKPPFFMKPKKKIKSIPISKSTLWVKRSCNISLPCYLGQKFYSI